MDVLARRERAQQLRITAQVRGDAQLDLRVVSRDHDVAWPPCLERAPDPLAELGPDGDVHQVRVGGRETARRRAGLSERRVDPAAEWIHQLRQGVDVRGLEL